jgi:hypothetical protein
VSRLALVACLGTAAPQRLCAADIIAPEHQIKAAFLYNFAKFVEWPAGSFANSTAPLVVGVLGNDGFGPALEQTFQGKTVNGRPLEVRRLEPDSPIHGCHMLFIEASETQGLRRLVDAARNPGTLVVGETEGFLQRGGAVNFLTQDHKVRFEINLAAAEDAQLRLSSKLLSLASSVTTTRTSPGK